MHSKSNIINKYLDTAHADISAAIILQKNGKFIFAIQPKNRWNTGKNGETIIPFGGIGGKLDANETPVIALKRECKEEINADVMVISSNKNIPIITPTGITMEKLSNEDKPFPLFIFVNPRSEVSRKKPFTNIFVYLGKVKSGENMIPIDNPAIIELDINTLSTIINMENVTLEKALSLGAIITTKEILPSDGILFPTPTPRGLIEYMKLEKKCKRIV